MIVQLTVHHAADEIGGNCIEIAAGGTRLVLDVGRPLNAPANARGVLLASLDTAQPVAGVLLSHLHLDHYGFGSMQ
jgi:ribonuclease J